MLSKGMHFILSLTWGLPMTFIGIVVSLILLALGYRPKKYGWCWYFEIGHGWGGLELGLFFLCSKDASNHVKTHEFGHSIQNCFFGPLMLFVVSIPSAIRYWFRTWKISQGETNLPPYDSIWFEGQATRLGNEYMNMINSQSNK